MRSMREMVSGLLFPEGPVALDDGSVLVGEIARGTVTRVTRDGRLQVVARCGGGPNGLAIGPDGALWVCNNGGTHHERVWVDSMPVPGFAGGELLVPMPVPGPDPHAGSIQRVDLATGRVEDVYTECDGRPLCAPNDLVFDAHGGFWFTDHGKIRDRARDRTGVFYATASGSLIREAIFPLEGPNGIGLSPDGASLYVAETTTARLWRFPVVAPGEVALEQGFVPLRGELVYDPPGKRMWDSLAVEECGNICLATLIEGGVTVVSPAGERIEHVSTPDPATTNVCFGGPDLRTAYVTLSGVGKLVEVEWARPGLRLHHQVLPGAAPPA
jgi:gluconolactonase